MLVLSGSDLRSSVTMEEAIAAAEQAYRALSTGEVTTPLRTSILVPEGPGVSLFMPGYVPSARALGAKIVSVFEKNPARRLATIQAVFILLDTETGRVLCMMEAASLTALRTGAGSGVATKHLANPRAATAAVFGAGVQARTQLEAIVTVRPISQVLVYDISPERAADFIKDMSIALEAVRPGIVMRSADSPEEAVRQAEVVVCATTSAVPLFPGAAVRAGAHINAIGSFTPDRRELDEALLTRASKVVVDSREAAMSEAGEFIIPMKRGAFTESIVHAEMGEILLGKRPGRQSPDEVTVYKAVGVAPLDLVVGRFVYERAMSRGLGKELPGF